MKVKVETIALNMQPKCEVLLTVTAVHKNEYMYIYKAFPKSLTSEQARDIPFAPISNSNPNL